jgi:hypothetical protein
LTEQRITANIAAVGGAIAQLGERLNGIQEVSGSIPLSSTKIILPACFIRSFPAVFLQKFFAIFFVCALACGAIFSL